MTDWTDLEPRLTPQRSAQVRAGLLTEITRSPARSRHRFTGIAVTAAATLTVAGTAAAWVSMTRPDDPNEGYCATSVTLDPDVWRTHGVVTAVDAQGNRDPLTCFSSNVALGGFDQSTPGGSGRWLWL